MVGSTPTKVVCESPLPMLPDTYPRSRVPPRPRRSAKKYSPNGATETFVDEDPPSVWLCDSAALPPMSHDPWPTGDFGCASEADAQRTTAATPPTNDETFIDVQASENVNGAQG